MQTKWIQHTFDVLGDTDLVYQIIYQAFPSHHKKVYEQVMHDSLNHDKNLERAVRNFNNNQFQSKAI